MRTVHETFVAAGEPGSLRDVTTRYDARNRPVARTTWLTSPGAIEPLNPPIAGLAGVAAANGLTEQYLYDDNLADGIGLESATGIAPLLGTGSISLSVALAKLADAQANGGAGITFNADAPGAARVSINPVGEVAFAISDATGRAVMNGILEPASGSSANSLITWNCTLHDAMSLVTGYGECLETRTINALGHAKKIHSDGAGRTIRVRDELDKSTLYTYDANGNQLSVRDPNNVGQLTKYDALGRATLVTDTKTMDTGTTFNSNSGNYEASLAPTGDTTGSVYDKAGNRIAAIDGKQHTTVYAFDARGRQVSITDRLSGVTMFTYLKTSQLESLKDAENQVTSYTFDSAGNKLTEKYPDHIAGSSVGNAGYGIVTFIYDPLGRVKTKTDQIGTVVTYNHDAAGRLLNRQYVGNSSADTDNFTYDHAGRMLTAASGRYTNTVGFIYDAAGRKATESLTISGQTYTVTTGYTAASQLINYQYPDGTPVTRGYSHRGEFTTIGYDGNTIDTRTYDNGGRMLSSAYNNGVSETRAYNGDNTLASINFSGAPIGNLSYTWDQNKNKTSESITGVMSGYGFSIPNNGYDSEDRLVSYQRTDRLPGTPFD